MDAVAIHQSLAIENFQYSYENNDLSHELTRFDEKRVVEALERNENMEVFQKCLLHIFIFTYYVSLIIYIECIVHYVMKV